MNMWVKIELPQNLIFTFTANKVGNFKDNKYYITDILLSKPFSTLPEDVDVILMRYIIENV